MLSFRHKMLLEPIEQTNTAAPKVVVIMDGYNVDELDLPIHVPRPLVKHFAVRVHPTIQTPHPTATLLHHVFQWSHYAYVEGYYLLLINPFQPLFGNFEREWEEYVQQRWGEEPFGSDGFGVMMHQVIRYLLNRYTVPLVILNPIEEYTDRLVRYFTPFRSKIERKFPSGETMVGVELISIVNPNDAAQHANSVFYEIHRRITGKTRTGSETT